MYGLGQGAVSLSGFPQKNRPLLGSLDSVDKLDMEHKLHISCKSANDKYERDGLTSKNLWKERGATFSRSNISGDGVTHGDRHHSQGLHSQFFFAPISFSPLF